MRPSGCVQPLCPDCLNVDTFVQLEGFLEPCDVWVWWESTPASIHKQATYRGASGEQICALIEPHRLQFVHMSYYPVFEILLRSATPIIAQGCGIIAHVFQELPIEPKLLANRQVSDVMVVIEWRACTRRGQYSFQETAFREYIVIEEKGVRLEAENY